MRKVKKVLEYHFDAGRSHRDIAMHCGVARRSVALLVERFEGSGLSWPEARDMDEGVLAAALYPPPPPRPSEDVDWARVEKELSERGVTLRLLWGEWRDDHPGGMSYPTWCRRFRARRRSQRAMTMRQVRSPGERLFVDYAGMTVALTIDGTSREAQIFVASMGVSGLVYAEATLTQKIDDWCASHVRCFEAMGCVPLAVVPDNLKTPRRARTRGAERPHRLGIGAEGKAASGIFVGSPAWRTHRAPCGNEAHGGADWGAPVRRSGESVITGSRS